MSRAGPSYRRPPPAPPSMADSEDDASSYSSSSTSVIEDEEGDELTPAMDAAILRTLHKIKSKQGVYSGEAVLQQELTLAQERASNLKLANGSKQPKEKPFTLADHHRQQLLAGEQEDRPLTHVQSEAKLRAETLDAFKSFADDEKSDASSDDEGFVPKKRGEGEDEEEDEDEYRNFLLEMGGGEDQVRKLLGMGDQPVAAALGSDTSSDNGVADAAPLSKVERAEVAEKRKKARTKKDDDFLMNYILNRGWIDKAEKHVPTYDEVVGRRDAKGPVGAENAKAGPSHPWGEIDEEDEFDEKAEAFEHEYNFRFEEPGSSNIISHPRQIASLVRRPDDSRKLKRQAQQERKAAKKAALEDETKRLKGAKRRELERDMAALKKEVGEGADWTKVEKLLEGDFDEREWEAVIAEVLAGGQGGPDDGIDGEDDDDDDEKPTWDDDIGDADYDEDEEEIKEEAEDGPVNMDADFIDVPEPSRKDKKGKWRVNEQDQSDDLTFEDRVNKMKSTVKEYRDLDHEDMIGDMPTRFKYTHTAPASYGLTPAEILMATDAELNSIMSIKKLATYRPRNMGYGMQGRNLNRRVQDLKQNLSKRKWGVDEESEKPKKSERPRDSGWPQRPSGTSEAPSSGPGNGPPAKGMGTMSKRPGVRLGKKERDRRKAAQAAEAGVTSVSVPSQTPAVKVEENGAGDEESRKKRRKKNRKKGANGEELKIFE